ncbi:MAG: hypothetical protein U1F00_19010 [Rhodoferax sp.]
MKTSAGTIGAVGDVRRRRLAGRLRDARYLDWLLERLLEARRADRLRLPGMKEDRRPIIGGGVILRAIFDLLQIDRMDAAARRTAPWSAVRLWPAAARTGATAALDLGAAPVRKFNADPVHGKRVGRVALASLFRQLAEAEPADADTERDLLGLHWAAELHEIGSHISHSDFHHKHGAYILDNADAMGFAQTGYRLGLLVLGQRGKLRKLEADFEDTVFVQRLCWRCGWRSSCAMPARPDITGMRHARLDATPLPAELPARLGAAGLSAIGAPAARGSAGLAEDAMVAEPAGRLNPASVRLPSRIRQPARPRAVAPA